MQPFAATLWLGSVFFESVHSGLFANVIINTDILTPAFSEIINEVWILASILLTALGSEFLILPNAASKSDSERIASHVIDASQYEKSPMTTTRGVTSRNQNK
jgi:hypothetical protein